MCGGRELFSPAEENLLCVKSASDLESKKSTVKHNRADFRRFITGTSLENEYIDDITKKDLEKIIIQNCIKKNAAYKVLNRICSNCGIKLDTTARKGTSAFRKTYSSKTYYAGGAEFESIVQGHSPDVAKKHYLDNDGLDMDEAVKILDAIGL